MHLDLIDALVCVAGHGPEPLIATIDRVEGRYISLGSLGCPTCHARYPIVDFIADFRIAGERPAARDSGDAQESEDRNRDATIEQLAAMLDLTVPNVTVILVGDVGEFAAELAVAYDAQCVALNPPPVVQPVEGVSILLTGARLPIRVGWAHAAAMSRASPDELAALAMIVAPGGRVVAPVKAPKPAGVDELARDERWWVARKSTESVSAPVSLGRRR